VVWGWAVEEDEAGAGWAVWVARKPLAPVDSACALAVGIVFPIRQAFPVTNSDAPIVAPKC